MRYPEPAPNSCGSASLHITILHTSLWPCGIQRKISDFLEFKLNLNQHSLVATKDSSLLHTLHQDIVRNHSPAQAKPCCGSTIRYPKQLPLSTCTTLLFYIRVECTPYIVHTRVLSKHHRRLAVQLPWPFSIT